MTWTLSGTGILFFVSILSFSAANANRNVLPWRYRRKITINHKSILDSDQHNFPVLITLKDRDLKDVTHGGHVAQSRGEDILFISSDGVTKLAHELEKYEPESGELRAWVKVPVLSHSTDAVLYLHYGNPDCKPQQNRNAVWDANYKMVLHLNEKGDLQKDSTINRNNAILEKGKNLKRYYRIKDVSNVDTSRSITVEGWTESKDFQSETIQSVVSRWSPLATLTDFDAYDAGETCGLDSKGFLGAVFDGRYIYFVPQANTTPLPNGQHRHGIVLRYDTHQGFKEKNSWKAYDAGNTSGLTTRGYYGAVFDGTYIYFVPRFDGYDYHTRVLRYDTRGEFTEKERWSAYDVGLPISYQSAGFDGRYIYFAPGFSKENKEINGKLVLRYDTRSGFSEKNSWKTYNIGSISGLRTEDFDGVSFDGRYMYFVPLRHSVVVRYDTQGEFKDKNKWAAFDAKPLEMEHCVGAVFDGQFIYFVPYDHHIVVRYDTTGSFNDNDNWSRYDVKNIPGLRKYGYDGGFFDGRYVYFIPFFQRDNKGVNQFHSEVLRYDTQGDFKDAGSWQSSDAGKTSGLRSIGYNGGASDGRFLYFAPWTGGEGKGYNIVGHGTVLRYDTLNGNGSFSLRYSDYGHNGGLCASAPGPTFIVNTDKGVLSVSANRKIEPGRHHIAGTYDGSKISLFIDGTLVKEKSGSGKIQDNDVEITIGRIGGGLGYFSGTIREVRISDIDRGPDWIKTDYDNQSSPTTFYRIGREEKN
jgi:hypothetical protein